jgi:ketosteroid isomerase-like protein
MRFYDKIACQSEFLIYRKSAPATPKIEACCPFGRKGIMVSRITILAAAFLLAPAAAAGQGSARPSLVAFADAFDHAQIAKDRRALSEMVSDELVFIDGTGKRLGKKDFIDGWTSAEDRYEPVVLEDRTITMLGNGAGIVGASATLRGVSAGKPFSSRFRFADTFRKIGGHWRAVHIQVTRIK